MEGLVFWWLHHLALPELWCNENGLSNGEISFLVTLHCLQSHDLLKADWKIDVLAFLGPCLVYREVIFWKLTGILEVLALLWPCLLSTGCDILKTDSKLTFWWPCLAYRAVIVWLMLYIKKNQEEMLSVYLLCRCFLPLFCCLLVE